ncbi:MAG: protoporphyrinogen oxidase [Planctomycetes bacterium]|nr:protoporphyrinogen oxidase [Planctomycetota bacterium]
MSNPRIAIVGGGPAGLAGAFWRLHGNPGADITVFEAGPRVGGWVQAERRDGFRCELGPQAVRPGAELDALVTALGLGDALVPAAATAKARWIGRGGRLLAAPSGPLSLLGTPLLSLRGKLRLFKEPFVAAGDPTGESLTDFVARRFGKETRPLVQAMVAGIFAGDADKLEIEGAFPVLAEAERAHGSVFRGLRKKRQATPKQQRRPRPKAALYSFAEGMPQLMQVIAARLGERVRADTPVRSLTRDGDGYRLSFGNDKVARFDEVVLACPAGAAAGIVSGLDPELARELAAIPTVSIANVHLGFSAATLPPKLQGFGFLLEPGEQCPVLGAIYVSSLFPSHAPAGKHLLRVMIGGRRHPEFVERTDDALVQLAIATIARYTGQVLAPEFVRVTRVRAAIPQYEHGHTLRMQAVERRLLAFPGLSLRGNSYRQVALSGQLGQVSGTDDAARR